jgi:hypothetical protein
VNFGDRQRIPPLSGQKVAYASAISLTDTSTLSAFSTASCKKRRSESLSANRLSTVTWKNAEGPANRGFARIPPIGERRLPDEMNFRQFDLPQSRSPRDGFYALLSDRVIEQEKQERGAIMKTKVTRAKFRSALGRVGQLFRRVAWLGAVILICSCASAQNMAGL